MARSKTAPTRHDAEGKAVPIKRDAEGNVVKPRKQHRWKPGTAALMEIRRLQKTTDLILPRSRVVKLIREIAGKDGNSIRFRHSALNALHIAAETEIIKLFERAMLVTVNGPGTTLRVQDMQTAIAVRKCN